MEVKILPSTVRKGYLEIFLDEELWKRVPRRYFRKHISNLLEAEDFKKEFASIEKKEAMQLGLDLLAERAYTKKNLRETMARRNLSNAAINEAIAKLEPYLDDEAMVRSMVRVMKQRGKGPRYILQRLRLKCDFSQEEIQTFIDDELTHEEQLEMAKTLLKKKFRKVTWENRAKANRLLVSRGYSFDIISAVMN